MILAILGHTPTWVFILLAVLVAVGLRLTRPGKVGLARLVTMPLAMGGLSLYSLLQAFGAHPSVVTIWAVVVAACLAAALVLGPRDGVQYSRTTATFAVPGSWLPLVLMMTIFFTRYVVAVQLAMHPELHEARLFPVAVATLYGLTSGAFAARALRIGLQAWRPRAASADLRSAA